MNEYSFGGTVLVQGFPWHAEGVGHCSDMATVYVVVHPSSLWQYLAVHPSWHVVCAGTLRFTPVPCSSSR
jgi:hypothetical protein